MGAFLPFRTERLELRSFGPADAEPFAAYRSDPDVARYQGWDAPYPLETAQRFVAVQSSFDGPVRGDWVQIAVTLDGHLVGDVAVGLDADGLVATIGYSLATAAQGRGLAREAVGAVVDGSSTTSASIGWRPRSTPSTWRRPASSRTSGSSTRAWPARPCARRLVGRRRPLRPDRRQPGRVARPAAGTGPSTCTWSRSTTHNGADVLRLRDPPQPAALRGPDGHLLRRRAVPRRGRRRRRRAVVPGHRGRRRAGRVRHAGRAHRHHPEPYLWRLLIDRRHQRRGIGDRVLTRLVDRLRAEGDASLLVSWNPGPGSPEPFYLPAGSCRSASSSDGEVEARLTL